MLARFACPNESRRQNETKLVRGIWSGNSQAHYEFVAGVSCAWCGALYFV